MVCQKITTWWHIWHNLRPPKNGDVIWEPTPLLETTRTIISHQPGHWVTQTSAGVCSTAGRPPTRLLNTAHDQTESWTLDRSHPDNKESSDHVGNVVIAHSYFWNSENHVINRLFQVDNAYINWSALSSHCYAPSYLSPPNHQEGKNIL